MFCNNCGTQQTSQSAYCINCGAALPIEKSVPPPPYFNAPSPQPYSQPYSQPPAMPAQPYAYPPQEQQPNYQIGSNYQPGNYVGMSPEYRPGSYLSQPPVTLKSSRYGVASLICAIVSFTFLPMVAAIPAMILGRMELNAIKRGEISSSGKAMAQIGFWIGFVNFMLYTLLIGFFMLLVLAR